METYAEISQKYLSFRYADAWRCPTLFSPPHESVFWEHNGTNLSEVVLLALGKAASLWRKIFGNSRSED